MKLAILGHGLEGRSAEQYFTKQAAKSASNLAPLSIKIYEDFRPETLTAEELQKYDLVFRSPSISPHKLPQLSHLTTVTQYFFDHLPENVTTIGVTGTKGKGTTSSLIAHLLSAFGEKVHLVGNIGVPAITALPKIKPGDVVVYELSSFQLWDLTTPPHIAVVLRIEPDHLNIHDDFADYVAAKSHIATHQQPSDTVIYYQDNLHSAKIAALSPGHRLPYPTTDPKVLKLISSHLSLPGDHNIENATAALAAIASFYHQDLPTFLASRKNATTVKQALQTFQGLPHRLEFIRELNGVKYYNDNYSTNLASLDVALKAFPTENIILIAGGISKDADESAIATRIFSTKNLKKAILIGEMKEALAAHQNPLSYICADTLAAAVATAHDVAESYADNGTPTVVVMSPAHASFDMFQNATDRGNQFTGLVKKLK